MKDLAIKDLVSLPNHELRSAHAAIYYSYVSRRDSVTSVFRKIIAHHQNRKMLLVILQTLLELKSCGEKYFLV